METTVPGSTQITVRVIAKGGKFLADDIGGAAVIIRNTQTQEILAKGVTHGDSGPNYVSTDAEDNSTMGALLQRGQTIPMNSTNSNLTCNFITSLELDVPTEIEVAAFGPLAARASAGSAMVTTWLYPSIDLTAGNGLLLEIPGLICQVLSPTVHTTTTRSQLVVATYVAMMCGCPISTKSDNQIIKGPAADQPWLPAQFIVSAYITQVIFPPPATPPPTLAILMAWDGLTPGRFVADQKNLTSLGVGTYTMRIAAQQPSTGNVGRDLSTFTLSG